MTDNEVLRCLDNLHSKILKSSFAMDVTENEMMALIECKKMIRVLQQYRSIGTVEECREAVERKKSQKVNGRYKTTYIWDAGYCPSCNCGITERWNYCQNCGQAIDWSK